MTDVQELPVKKQRRKRLSKYSGNRADRRVSVVMSDSHHTLILIELIIRVRLSGGSSPMFNARIDKNATEQLARERIAEQGKNPDEYDMVGVLVAQIDGHDVGRIVWAEEVEVVEAVTI